ncbi:MAG: MaoC family dehydratase N-terminal domain-containing protein [Propionibacteriaceae bacterium]|jgi:acyl dehydratase|nr:MaoC family dehydratase N-terminal domain-containing protein [Propionibacteriaceae bacterium]
MTTMYFEDLVEGQRWISQGRTVTETDVVNFSGLSGDFNPIHLDRESTKEGMFGQRVAHGILGIAMATGFLDSLGLFKTSMGAMLEIERWRFRKPIFIDDTIHLELTIASKRLTSKGTNGVVRRQLALVNQDGVVVQEGIITVIVLCRSAAPAGADPDATDPALTGPPEAVRP